MACRASLLKRLDGDIAARALRIVTGYATVFRRAIDEPRIVKMLGEVIRVIERDTVRRRDG